tara:strand:+ start:1615 stop:1809 length:195 start_codon:yes stop_codon:yes gene_type:complete
MKIGDLVQTRMGTKGIIVGVRRGAPQPDECDYDEFEVYWSADGVSFWYDPDDFGHRGELVVTSP